MPEASAYSQLGGLLGFLSNKPTLEQIVEYLSSNISPDGEIIGVSLAIVNDENAIDSVIRHGYKIDFPKVDNIFLNSNHPSAVALRTQEIQLVDLISIGLKFDEIPPEHRDTPYASACQIPLGESLLIALAFEFDIARLKETRTYFECIRASLLMYLALQTKNFINEFELSGNLTPRQLRIHEMILDGKSNRQIASELAYSVSLIRQETMRIYAKLGVDGRGDLKKLGNPAPANNDYLTD